MGDTWLVRVAIAVQEAILAHAIHDAMNFGCLQLVPAMTSEPLALLKDKPDGRTGTGW